MSTGQSTQIPARQPTAAEHTACFVTSHFNRTARLIGFVMIALAVVIAAAAYYGVMPKFDQRFALTTIALFAGALVSGLAGFAFSAVAGAILLQWLPPAETVPLLLVCSIT